VTERGSKLTEVSWLNHPEDLILPDSVRVTFTGTNCLHPPAASRPHQVHGDKIISASENMPGIEADGVYSSNVNEPIAVRTADCLPLLFYSQHFRFVLAVHAGWKGFVKGILDASLKTANAHGLTPEDLKLIIGPAIGLDAFEVGPEVADQFKEILNEGQQNLSMRKGINDRWHIDLQIAAVSQFVKLGVLPKSIQVLKICTKSNLNYHSFRREGQGCGHNFSVIERLG
jgi:YfiH family protein